MADGRYEYFEIVNAPHINQKVSDFDEICCAEANSDKDDSHFIEISAISKECFCHNSTPNFGQILYNDEKPHTDNYVTK